MRKALLISSLFITLVFALLSCEREIDIALESSGTSIVVEGIIEPGAAPRILITKNRGFFALRISICLLHLIGHYRRGG
jgi:hypothetical protein